MVEVFGYPIGTLAQVISSGSLLTILACMGLVWVKGIPDRLRVRLDDRSASTREWQEIERRVTGELEECKRHRAKDAETLAVVKEENYRLHIVVALMLQELQQLVPDSDAVRRAQIVLAAVTGRPKFEGQDG